MEMTSKPFTADRAKNREELLAGVERIRDVLAAQCEEEEAAATLSAKTVQALVESGIFAMKLPCVLGGAEADPVTQFEVIEAVAAINASAGWCTMVGATSIGLPGAFLPDEGIEQMFAGKHIPCGAICIMRAVVVRERGPPLGMDHGLCADHARTGRAAGTTHDGLSEVSR